MNLIFDAPINNLSFGNVEQGTPVRSLWEAVG